MASGFENEHKGVGIRTAIKTASLDGTLVFAAASNYGNVRQIAFPGRMKDVFCMFSTDGRAKISQSINPAPKKKAYNFAILGEKVALSPLGPTITGTSVATSIGAGLAGRLIDFSRQKDCRGKIRRRANLRSIEGMSAVFAYLAKGGDDNGYNCIAPWRLIQHLSDETERSRTREIICDQISMALENMEMDF